MSPVYFAAQTRLTSLRGAQRFRNVELVDGLGWDLTVVDGREVDEFDNADALHCLIRSEGEIVGYFRTIRTDRPYLAATKFPDLATRRPYPHSPVVWELSRIAVKSSERRFETALHLYSTMMQVVSSRGGVAICGFVDTNHERLFARAGLITERYGEPAVIGADRFGRPITVVAGEIPFPKQSGARFERLISLVRTMEVDDADTVLRRSSLSA